MSIVTYCGVTEIATVFDPEVCVCVCVCVYVYVYPFICSKTNEEKKAKIISCFYKTCQGGYFSYFFVFFHPLSDCKHTLDN